MNIISLHKNPAPRLEAKPSVPRADIINHVLDNEILFVMASYVACEGDDPARKDNCLKDHVLLKRNLYE